jgi:hypothetical protein
MKTIATPVFLSLILALGLVNVWAAPTSDFISSGKTLVLTDADGPAKFLCVPDAGADGKTVKLICVAGDSVGLKRAVPQQPARNNAEIMRMLYDEKNEAPFWK